MKNKTYKEPDCCKDCKDNFREYIGRKDCYMFREKHSDCLRNIVPERVRNIFGRIMFELLK